METTDVINEPVYTAEELAGRHRLHPATIRKLFRNEAGVIRLGCPRPGKRQHLSLRIPHSVAARVFQRMTVGGADVAA